MVLCGGFVKIVLSAVVNALLSIIARWRHFLRLHQTWRPVMNFLLTQHILVVQLSYMSYFVLKSVCSVWRSKIAVAVNHFGFLRTRLV